MIEKKPIITKSITAFCTVSAGDAISQGIECYTTGRKFKLDRTLKFASFAIIFTPFTHAHYSVIMPYLIPSSTRIDLLKSVIFDQTFYVGTYFFSYYAFMNIITNKSYSDFKTDIREKYVPAIKANWMFWPGIMLMSFIYVPIIYRVLYLNVCGIAWNTYFSYSQNMRVSIKK